MTVSFVIQSKRESSVDSNSCWNNPPRYTGLFVTSNYNIKHMERILCTNFCKIRKLHYIVDQGPAYIDANRTSKYAPLRAFVMQTIKNLRNREQYVFSTRWMLPISKGGKHTKRKTSPSSRNRINWSLELSRLRFKGQRRHLQGLFWRFISPQVGKPSVIQ